MIKFTKRYTEADNQQAQYDEKSPDEKAANKDDVIKLIKEWIKGSGLEKIVSKPVEINLSELNELVIERDIKQDKVDAVSNTKKSK